MNLKEGGEKICFLPLSSLINQLRKNQIQQLACHAMTAITNHSSTSSDSYRYLISTLTFLLLPLLTIAQISSDGIPPGYMQAEKDNQIILYQIPAPDTEQLLKEDRQAGRFGVAERIGVLLPVAISPNVSGHWAVLPDGSRQWRVRINSAGAKSLSLYFSNFYLPEGCSLYIYNQLRTRMGGAYTHQNNHKSGFFVTELIPGDDMIVELLVSQHVFEKPEFLIKDVLYAYNKEGQGIVNFGDSGECNVNVNCSEGDAWQDQKKGVVKIHSRVGSIVFRCTGSLVNNTSYDFSPYVYTADHCARAGSTYASADDLNQWVFFFNYEAPDCPNPEEEPPFVALTGATLKANVGGGSANMGSDFYLVLLNQNIPPAVSPYFNGWSRRNVPSGSGVGIHHPSGDIKKISTYAQPLINSSWNANTPNMYWQVRWSATENGHGVTEGGSSGSPLFNSQGLIVGQLTGGQASCANPNAPDYYGKFSTSWESIGTTPERQLKPWLDPENFGVETLQGSYDTLQVIARFAADTTFTQTGYSIGFSDLSLGEPTEWHWIFDGGEPRESFSRNPGKITYKRYGKFDVTLVVRNEHRTDSLVRKEYIQTVPGMFPNPANDQVTFSFGSHDYEIIRVEIYDMHGILSYSRDYNISGLYSVNVYTGFLRQGAYVINFISHSEQVYRQKLLIAR
jgi:PKD repeat protein